MKIIEKEVKSYFLCYEDADGEGYAFPCDKDGHIHYGEVFDPETTRKRLEFCKSHPERYKRYVLSTLTSIQYGICPYCGHHVQFSSSCRAECCGKRYNIFGQEVLPPWEGTPWE